MKRQKIFLTLIFSLFSLNIYCNSEKNKSFTSSKSFFFVEPVFRPGSAEVLSIRRDALNVYCDKKITIDIAGFGGESAHPDRLARYFLPFNKTEILVGELGSNAVNHETVDVIANYFGVFTSALFQPGDPIAPTLKNYTFESKLSFRPKHNFVGFAINYRQHLSRYTDKGIWWQFILPFEHVKNDLHLCEKIITPGGPNGNDPQVPEGFFGNMTQAFMQTNFIYGKIAGPQKKTGIADLYIMFGYTYVKEETHYLESYFGVGIPTSMKPKGEFVFEPTLGNNGHPTLFTALSGGFKIWCKCDKSVYYVFDTVGTLFGSNHQTRSLDLKGKPWSRYIWVFSDDKAVRPTPGINVFTQRVEVNAGTSRDLNTAFIFRDCGFQAEAGYHFFARQAEEIKLVCPFKRGPAIAAIYNDNTQEFIAGGLSRDNATINEYIRIKNDSVNGNQIFKPIEESDLDLESAAHPGLISHEFYLALSYNWDTDCCDYPKFVGFAGSYEFSSNNSVLSRWMVWARLGISF